MRRLLFTTMLYQPLEYGTTLAEKRSVGIKICHGLLEKINADLLVARTDNHNQGKAWSSCFHTLMRRSIVDMRYLINMDYSADLPINTMGRRIRTRLYFTSESHLHTVLNVLRFTRGSRDKSILSPVGETIINSTPGRSPKVIPV